MATEHRRERHPDPTHGLIAVVCAACGSPPPAARPAPPAAIAAAPVAATPDHAPDAVARDHVPFSADDRAGELAFLRDALRDSYAHLEVKQQQWGVDLDKLYARYEPAIREADTWAKYEGVMVGFVSEMHDAHVDWRRKRGAGESKRHVVRLGLDTRFVGPALYISEVWPGSSAEKVGLKVGDKIVKIDDQTLEQRMAKLAGVRSWSRAEAQQHDFAEAWPASRVAADAPAPERDVTRERDDGSQDTLKVTAETTPRPGGKPAALELEQRGDVAILHVRNLSGATTKLAEMLDPLVATIASSAKGLVIDLRGDEGGFEDNAKAVATKLLARSVTGGSTRVRLSQRARDAHKAWHDLAADPAKPGWSVAQPVQVDGKAPHEVARIAVVIDVGCRSSCETLALLMRGAGARLYGERTGGASGAPIKVTLPKSGATVDIPARAMFDAKGTPIEGNGVDPDEPVAETRADLIAHRDPALAAAIDHVCPKGKGACK
jgi:carboxyl-terminal processing protease